MWGPQRTANERINFRSTNPYFWPSCFPVFCSPSVFPFCVCVCLCECCALFFCATSFINRIYNLQISVLSANTEKKTPYRPTAYHAHRGNCLLSIILKSPSIEIGSGIDAEHGNLNRVGPITSSHH